MGYQQGKGLGKDQSGRAAPIDVKLKSDRLGLGGEEAKKRKQQHLQQQQAEAAQKRMRNQEQQAGEFKQASVARAAHRRAEGLVCDARKAIEMLDHRQRLPKSHLWPPEPKQMPEDDQEAAEDIPKTAAEADQQAWEELPVQARLAEALDYLRQRYHYCLFCGCQICVLLLSHKGRKWTFDALDTVLAVVLVLTLLGIVVGLPLGAIYLAAKGAFFLYTSLHDLAVSLMS
eukprot:jgi/Astpho2/5400/Aster-07352